jgi:hypothetical protein
MRRRLSLIVGFIFVFTPIALEFIIGRIGDESEFFGSWNYYGLVIALTLLGFGGLVYWAESNEKTDTDELEEHIEELFENQTSAIKKLTDEIRKERKMWHARFKNKS